MQSASLNGGGEEENACFAPPPFSLPLGLCNLAAPGIYASLNIPRSYTEFMGVEMGTFWVLPFGHSIGPLSRPGPKRGFEDEVSTMIPHFWGRYFRWQRRRHVQGSLPLLHFDPIWVVVGIRFSFSVAHLLYCFFFSFIGKERGSHYVMRSPVRVSIRKLHWSTKFAQLFLSIANSS